MNQKRQMPADSFIKNVVGLYRAARFSKFKHGKVRRGRSHSVSSAAEDLFARFLVDQIECEEILVDQSLHISGFKKAFYPDITVVRRGKIVAFCDLKMDLGWKRRELVNFCESKTVLLKKIRGMDCSIRDGQTKMVSKYVISSRARMNVVIVSGKNINQALLGAHLAKAKLLDSMVGVYVLSNGEHPNAYGIGPQALMKKIKINYDSFSDLIERLN